MIERPIFFIKEWLSPRTGNNFNAVSAYIDEVLAGKEKLFEVYIAFTDEREQVVFSRMIDDQKSLEIAIEEIRVLKNAINSFFRALKTLREDLPEEKNKKE